MQKRGWQGPSKLTDAGPAAGAARPRGWSVEQQLPLPPIDQPQGSLSYLGSDLRRAEVLQFRLQSLSLPLLVFLVAAAFLAGYAVGRVTGRKAARHDRAKADLSSKPKLLAAAESSTSHSSPADLQSPASQANSHSCSNVDVLEADEVLRCSPSISSNKQLGKRPESVQSQCQPNAHATDGSISVEGKASASPGTAAGGSDHARSGRDLAPNSTLQSMARTTPDHQEQLPSDDKPENDIARFSQEAVSDSAHVDAMSTSPLIPSAAASKSQPLVAIPPDRGPIALQRQREVEGPSRVQTMIRHDGSHVSLRDAESWDWMMTILQKRIGVRDTLFFFLVVDVCKSPKAKPGCPPSAYQKDT